MKQEYNKPTLVVYGAMSTRTQIDICDDKGLKFVPVPSGPICNDD
jgi:hypothetical protein